MSIRFEGQVAIVTGAGQGLGRAHALALAARGAKVVVNDIGGGLDGSGGSTSPGEAVVHDILAAGGEAVLNGADVSDYGQVEAMVAETMARWGRVDILVNNAGILRDKSFAKLELSDFRKVIEVHLFGSVNCTKACWEIMRAQEYGRIIMTTSSAGLYGNFGQAAYGSAKLALVGLMNTLAKEGAKTNIRVNALAPAAATRMTENLLTPEQLELLSPDRVAQGVLFLACADAPTKVVLTAGAGSFAVARIVESRGQWLAPEALGPEGIAEAWSAISDPQGEAALVNVEDQTQNFLALAAAGTQTSEPSA